MKERLFDFVKFRVIKTAFDATKEFPVSDEVFDLVITDPPWFWSDKFPGGFGLFRSEGFVGYKTTLDFRKTFREIYRVLKPNCHFYCWVTNQHLPILFEQIKEVPFKYLQLITWVKNTFGLGYTYRGKTEHVALFVKKPYKRRIKSKNLPNVFYAKNPFRSVKPLEILKIFVEESSDPGDFVFDPFAGSGIIKETCEDRKFWINDIKYKEEE